MPEEALREIAATNEPPNRLASSEFFFLLQRIDRLDEKLTARIDRLEEKIERADEKLSGRINKVEEKIDGVQDRLDRVQDRVDTIKLWAISAVITLIAGFAGVIITLLHN